MKKCFSIVMVLVLLLTSLAFTAAAEGAVLPTLVTEEMCHPSYWYDKGIQGSDKVLATTEEIAQINQGILDTPKNYVVDIYNLADTCNADQLRNSLASEAIPTRALYINGKRIDNTAYFTALHDAMRATGYTGQESPVQFAVITKRTELMSIPTRDYIGYDAEDADSEYTSSALNVNDPFVIKQKCDIGDETFYYGNSVNCTGWIYGGDLAICKDRAEWIAATKMELGAKDFLVVTQDKIVTEPSVTTPYSSEVKLLIGTTLKLVPEDKIPETIGNRGAWNNYVVYLPVRNAQGRLEQKPALISQHCSVSIGFLPFTQENFLQVSMSCLGNVYGWAGMMDSMDCSLYNRNVYRCFGFEIPRNTSWQRVIPSQLVISMTNMTDTQREQFVKTLPIGTMLYFSGHTMMYVGTVNDIGYVISDLGTVVDVNGDLTIKKVHSVALTPLTVRRGNGRTWLSNMEAAVVMATPTDLAQCDVTLTQNELGEPAVTVTYNGNPLYEGINYTVELQADGSAVVTGVSCFTGSVTVTKEEEKPLSPILRLWQTILNFFRRIWETIFA